MTVARRRFVIGLPLALFAAPVAVGAQPTKRVYRLGVLAIAPIFTSLPVGIALADALRELGYVEGKNLVVERRYAEGQAERFPELAAELVHLKLDAILVVTTPAAIATKAATTTVPVVFVAAIDPVGAGLAASLARPGGNVTGFTTLSPELSAKRLEVLRELLPGVTRVAVVSNTSNAASAFMLRQTDAAGRQLGMALKTYGVRGPDDLDDTFAAVARERPEALLFLADAMFFRYRDRLAHFALRARLPAVFENKEMAEAGGLVSYGANLPEMFRRAASYVDRVFRGQKPADLPFEQPGRFELAINMKTAKALGLTIPPSLLLRADHVIE